MQIKTNGNRNITLDFEAPKKFRLLQSGVEIPYIRTGKNSLRLSKTIDGILDLEEIQEKPQPIVKPMQLQAQQMALVNPADVVAINQAAQQLEIEQNILNENQKRFENVQNYVDIQQQRINESIEAINALETDNQQRISVTEQSIFNLAGEIAKVENEAIDGSTIVYNGLEAHKTAENPHNITKKTIGLDKVNNTADMDKPVSKAVQKALDEKADKDEIQAIRDELGEYQEKNDRFTNALSNYTGGLAYSGSDITIDDMLSTESENPVQNKVITNALNEKADISDIPTVNNATLTIQKNGTNAGTFSANASEDVNINLIVPTTASDVSALPDSTKYGAGLSLTINSTNYVMTAQLKDQDGNNLGTAQTIDLPLESVVVNGAYDSVNKKIILTLQNGTTIDIPVGDLISGLQTEITSSNKLSADLVDDTSTSNKFVTASDITTWNAKQDALTAGTDLEIVSISHNLPAEYQELRYIQGIADTQYIDTGIVPTSSMNMYGKFMMIDRGSSNVALFGARGSSAFSGVYAWTTTSQVKAQWFLTADAQRLNINDSAQTFNTYEYYFENNACIIKKNGREIGYKAFTPQGSVTQTLYVNALNNNNSVGSNNGATVRIYRFTIENKCDLIPAKRISDSKVGMYDIIRNQFLTNAGSDDFTAGSDITGSGLEINFTNDSGYITDITSSDVTTALGYTPYDASNPNGYTSNVGTVTSVNNTSPDGNGNVTLSIPAAQVNSDWDAVSGVAQILNKPSLATVATTGDYGDLLNKPTIPAAQIQSDWTQADNTKLDYIKNKPNLATVATSGSYNDLSNKPTIPAAQVNSDWNAVSGVAQILNKPTLGTMASESASDYTPTSGLATVATSGAYGDLSGTPTIPTVNNSTITLTQGGVTKGSFTLNQSSGATIDFDAGGGGSLPSQTGHSGEFLTTDGTDTSWAVATKVTLRRL